MTINLFRSFTGTRLITVPALFAVSALLLLVVASSPAHAAGGRSPHVLKQGTGMFEGPSVRVRSLQRTLARRGYSVGRHGADGLFGPRTARAVRRFQSAHHLRVDGVVGPRTRAELRRTTRSATRRAHRSRHTVTKSSTSATPRRPSTTPTKPSVKADEASPQPQPVPSGQPAPAPLRVDSGPAWWRSPLLLGLLAALVVAFGGVAVARYERRARAATYRRSRRTSPVTALVVSDTEPATTPSTRPATVEPAVIVPVVAPPATVEPAVVAPPATVGRYAAHGHVIGYVPGPAGQRGADSTASDRAIERVCARGGWTLLDIVHDPEGSSLEEQSGISHALERIAAGEASALVVSDARLLGRSVDLAAVLRRLDDAGAALVAVDLGLDTTTAQGRRVASALVTVSGWGRQRAVDAAAGGRRRTPEKWVGRLSLDQIEAPAIAHVVTEVNGHAGTNGHDGADGNGTNGHDGATVNGASDHHGHNGHAHDGADEHDGNGVATTYQNGHVVIAEDEDAATLPDEEALAS